MDSTPEATFLYGCVWLESHFDVWQMNRFLRPMAKVTWPSEMVTAGEKATGNNFFLIYPGNTSMITFTISENPVSEDEAPRSDDTYNAGEELVTDVITAIDNSSSNEANGINPPGVPLVDVVSDRLQYTSFNKKINIATWNVRSMYEGKLNLVKNEMERMNLSILGISEMKWKGRGYFQSEGYRVFF